MSQSNLENHILAYVQHPHYRPAKPRDIAKQLGLSADESRDVRRVVKQLVKKGILSYGSNHLVLPAKVAKSNQVTGSFHRAAAGFGFIRPNGTAKSSGRDLDVYVPAENSLDAANGDIVVANIVKKRRGREWRNTGEITEILERNTRQFVGTYLEDDGHAYVQIDGSDFPDLIYVGDPGAKNAKENAKVVIEMVHFPRPGRRGEAVITHVLGKQGQPGVDTQLIIHEFSLPEEFPEDAIASAREAADRFDESDLSGRRDFTKTTVITIDPKDARDFDDAISLKRLKNGHWELAVHIADVAHFVPPKSGLDVEARRRSTSVYLPDQVIPMLPEIISNNLASLQPDKVRYAKTAIIEFTADGARVHTEACSAAIQSDRRFTYEEVDDYLDDAQRWKSKLTPEVHQLLADMHELAMVLRQRRMQAGALELSMREVKIDLDKDGRVTGAHQRENTVSHQIIEEFMLAANVAVAEMLRDRDIPLLRRIHGNPNPKKLKMLTEFVRHLGFDVESLESRFELQALLEDVRGLPEEYAINYAVLRSFQKAVYSPEDEGHYALAADCYCHFTSPIRRYPDLTIHRLIDDIEHHKKKPGLDRETLIQLGDHCSEREQRAEQAERELTKLKLLNFLNDRIGTQLEAVITGVEPFGFFVMGTDLPAEGLVHIDSLDDEHYDYDDSIHAIISRRGKSFSLGDTVEVEVASVDLSRRTLELRWIRTISGRQLARGETTKNSRRVSSRDRRRGKPASKNAHATDPTGRAKPSTSKSKSKSKSKSEPKPKPKPKSKSKSKSKSNDGGKKGGQGKKKKKRKSG